MSTQLRLFYASDIHGSERVFRKFLNAAGFYKVQAIVFGGDLTGKAMIPFVQTSPGTYEAEVFGVPHVVGEGSALAELEQFVRDRGSYAYRTTPDEMAALQGDPALVSRTFSRVMLQTAEKWVTLADERLRAAGIQALMMPGNDDEPEVKKILAQGEWIIDAEDRLVDLAGYQVIRLGVSATARPAARPSINVIGDIAADYYLLLPPERPGDEKRTATSSRRLPGVAHRLDEVDPERIGAADITYVTGSSAAITRIAAAGTSLRLVAGVEADMADPDLAATVANVDLLITNSAGWANASGRAAGAVTAVETRGPEGAVIHTPSRPDEHIPGIGAETVDATGAGDCFAGALCHYLASGLALAAACRLAVAAAGLSTEALGAQTALPTDAQVRAAAGRQPTPTARPGEIT